LGHERFEGFTPFHQDFFFFGPLLKTIAKVGPSPGLFSIEGLRHDLAFIYRFRSFEYILTLIAASSYRGQSGSDRISPFRRSKRGACFSPGSSARRAVRTVLLSWLHRPD
jgi:hypothetical protein